ncbi:MAG: DUF1552 domain-containing protein [Sandaracinaceae bacterium]
MTKRRGFSRRDALRALGIGSAAALFPSAVWRPSRAKAQDGPPRVIFLTTQHGAPRQHWKMDLPGLAPDADSAVDLGPLDRSQFSQVLDPLYDVRQRLTVVEGLAMMSAMLDEPGNNHGVSWAHLLTNHPADYTNPYQTGGGAHPYATAISIDQYIASQTAAPGTIPSVEWGYGGRFGSGPIGYSTDTDGAWLPFEDSPSRAFDRLFPMGPPMPDDPTPPTRRELIRAERPSVLDLAARQYDRVMPTLGAADRDKLMLHQQRIRELELQLRAPGGGGGGAMCDPTFDSTVARMDAFFRLTTIALSCDLTRVIALNVGQLTPSEFGAPPGDVHQDYAHGTSVEAYQYMADYYRVHAEQLKTLIGYLDEVPEGDGTLLDNTMIVWLTELATGGHDMADGITVVAGGGRGALHPGRYVRFAQNRPAPCRSYGCQSGASVGPGQSHLFVSAMRAMGMSDDGFGQRSGTALDGSTIDMTGPLPML